MTLVDHIAELRRRLIVSLIAIVIGASACFALYEPIFRFFFAPFESLTETLGSQLFANYLYEGFITKLKLSAITGIIITLPVHVFGILRFVFPGLVRRERRIIAVALVVASILAVFGFYYGYYYIVPLTIQFFTGSDFFPEHVGMLLGFERNIFYVLQFLLVSMLVFQLPIVIEILMILNLVSRKRLLKASRFVIVVTFLLAALFTPPDFVSQIAVAIPLVALYFLALLVARIFGFGNVEAEE